MKTTVIEGVEFQCPMYLVRAGAGWQVRVPGEPTRFFSDGLHGSTENAFKAALSHRRNLMPITSQQRVLPSQEKASKLYPTGEPGVFLNKKWKRDRKAPEYAFSVTRPGSSRATVYIGTEKTWEQNYEAKLAVAIDIRRQAISQHIVQS